MLTIQPRELHERIGHLDECRVIDVREPDEYARGHVPGANCVPGDSLDDLAGQWPPDQETIVICWSGACARLAAQKLEARGFTHVTLLDGGTKAWQQAGLPTDRTRRGIPIQRQVLIGAGLVHLLSLGLALVDPWFLAIAVFASSMLVVAGVTGFCPMAIGLSKMPWNRESVPAAGTPASGPDASGCCSTKGATCQQ